MTKRRMCSLCVLIRDLYLRVLNLYCFVFFSSVVVDVFKTTDLATDTYSLSNLVGHVNVIIAHYTIRNNPINRS